MVNLATIAVAFVSVWYEATPPNAAGFFLPRRRRFWYKTAACITAAGGRRKIYHALTYQSVKDLLAQLFQQIFLFPLILSRFLYKPQHSHHTKRRHSDRSKLLLFLLEWSC